MPKTVPEAETEQPEPAPIAGPVEPPPGDPTGPDGQCCAFCKFYRPRGNRGHGVCRRFPPTPILNWRNEPMLRPAEWCGEFAPSA